MGLIDAVRSHVMALPDLAKFAVVVAAIVGVPRLAARIRLPPMVGLLLFGVALGPHVLGFFGEHRPIANFFGELGKLLLMFSAGLEIDIALFREAQARSITFGLLTTSVPLLFGTLPRFWLCAHPGDRRQIAARIPHVVECTNSSETGCHSARTDRRDNRRHSAVGHTFIGRVRGLRLDVYDRLLVGSACHPAHRDRRLCAADPDWAQSRRRLGIEQDGD
jgi:hypothetical protein